jgi:hypothetical protein
MRVRPLRPGPVLVAAAAAALVVALPAGAAYVCHPDPAGTRTLTLPGRVAAYSLQGNRVQVVYRAAGGCLSRSWTVSGRASSPQAAACASAVAPATEVVAKGRTVRLVAGAPDRLHVRVGGRLVHDWPLPERMATLDVDGGIALLGTAGHGTYAVRLSDGRAALVALTRRGDTPQIERAGIVFQDNLYKKHAHLSRTILKFVPRAAVERALARAGRPLHVGGVVRDLAMDGPRVALAVDGAECDRVVFWNVPWSYVSRITEEEETTCESTRGGASPTAVSIGNLRASWVISSPAGARVLAASSIDCVERLVSRGSAPLLGGDGALLAYSAGAQVGTVDARMRGRALRLRAQAPVALAADGGRLALLRADGVVEIRSDAGRVHAQIATRPAQEVALQGDRLVVLTRAGTLDVYDAAGGVVLRRVRVPAGARGVDVHFGYAVVAAGRSVVAVELATGRTAVLAHAPAPVQARIEAPGVAYAFSTGRRGEVRFVPMAAIEAAFA